MWDRFRQLALANAALPYRGFNASQKSAHHSASRLEILNGLTATSSYIAIVVPAQNIWLRVLVLLPPDCVIPAHKCRQRLRDY